MKTSIRYNCSASSLQVLQKFRYALVDSQTCLNPDIEAPVQKILHCTIFQAMP